MTIDSILTTMRVAGLPTHADALQKIVDDHEKEKSAAIACLRQMDKIKAENTRLHKQITKLQNAH